MSIRAKFIIAITSYSLSSLFLNCASSGATAQVPEQPQSNETARIEGVVLSTVDKKPIAGVSVRLAANHLSAVTDENGRFTFSGVPLGSDLVDARKQGFLCMSTPMQPHCMENVDIAGSDIHVALSMMPQAVVDGRIVDQAGEPIEGLSLSLMHREIVDGLYAWQLIGQTVKKTDAEGRYHIAGLEPGTYLLKTSNMVDPRETRADADHGYAATYYPGVLDRREARPIVLQAGQNAVADLTVGNERFQQVTLTFAWNRTWARGSVGFGFSGEDREDYLHPILDDAHRAFHLFAPAGSYRFGFVLYPPPSPNSGGPQWPDGSKQPFFGSAEFSVKAQPVTVTDIVSQQPANILLHVRFELTEQEKRKAAAKPDDPYYPPSVWFRISGGQLEFDNQASWRVDQRTSDLEFRDIPPGSYVVGNAASRAYVASLTCGNINLLREPLVIGPGVPLCSIEATVRDDMASITIGLTPKAKAELTAAGITVTDVALIPAENLFDPPYSSAVWRDSESVKKAIPAGKYLVFLFDGRAIAWRDPGERQHLMRVGTVVTLAPGESKSVLLDWRPELNDPHVQPAGVALGRVLP